MPVFFDGNKKLIVAQYGTTTLDVQEDIYEPWKQWIQGGTGAAYKPAFLSEGNVGIGGGLFTGKFFILINDWKIRPFEADHNLTINGNIFGLGGAEIIAPTLGEYQVLVTIERSLEAQSVGGEGSASGIWDYTDPVTGKSAMELIRGNIDGLTIEKSLTVMLSILAGKFSVVNLENGSTQVTFFKRDQNTSTVVGTVTDGVRVASNIQEGNL